VHHFGSKQDLLTAALKQAMKIQEDVRDGWLKRQPEMTKTTELRKWWKWLNESPANLALTRLGLEAVTLEATHTGLSGDVRAEQIGVWREQIEQSLIGVGVPPAIANTEASLLKGMFTGLILDLIATGDKARLSKALELGLSRTEAVIAACHS
jgi:AcrR family transcriptional regulator